MKTSAFLIVSSALSLAVSGCALSPNDVDPESVTTTGEDALTSGDPLPPFAPFVPVYFTASSGGCLGTDAVGADGRGISNLGPCDAAAARRYSLQPVGNGHYRFQDFEYGLCLAVPDAATANGAAVLAETCDERDSEEWRAIELTAGRYRLEAEHGGACLSAAGGTLQTAACDDADQAQRFAFYEGESIELHFSESGTYWQPRCLDVNGWSTADGARVQQWKCRAQQNQRFYPLSRISDDGVTQYELRAAHDGKCLAVEGADDRNGAPIVQETCTGAPHQRWRRTFTSYGTQLRARHVDKCLERSDDLANGASVYLGACRESPNQSFSRRGPGWF